MLVPYFLNSSSTSLVDIIQAISDFCAIPGAIAAFILLFQKDKDKQKQIDSLSIMSEQLINIALSQQEQIKSLSILAESSIISLEKQEEIKETIKSIETSHANIAKLTKQRGR